MGYDVYGINPQETVEKPEILNKDWTKLGKKQTDKYFEAMQQHQDENPGVYFRNNVWWWRPLWDYVCEICEGVMSKEDMEAGGSNSGYEIDENTIECMLIKLRIEIALGNHKRYEKEYKKWQKNLPLEECSFCKGTGQRNDEFAKGKCNACDGKGEKKPWSCSYPFSSENVEEFVAFLEQSGGIRIC
tara:strand:- start:212 stop:772 length:561 start_codon:yes stop_codon:yes gene_type:complete